MNLLDRINLIKVNSVTANDYERFWGVTLEEEVDELMDFARQFDASIKIKEESIDNSINQPH